MVAGQLLKASSNGDMSGYGYWFGVPRQSEVAWWKMKLGKPVQAKLLKLKDIFLETV